MINLSYVSGYLNGRKEEVQELFNCEILALIGSFAQGKKRDPLELVVSNATCKEALRVYLSGEFPITRIKIRRIAETRAEEMAGAIYILGNEPDMQRFRLEIE